MAFKPEWDKLGLTVSDDELVDMVQGDNINPGIKQAFTDKATGQFDKARLIEYLKNLDKLPPKPSRLAQLRSQPARRTPGQQVQRPAEKLGVRNHRRSQALRRQPKHQGHGEVPVRALTAASPIRP
jgi:hypothetical protein